MTETDAQFAAAVDLAAYNFFKIHYKKDRLSACTANRVALERYIDESLLDASKAESWEIAFLAVGHQLAKTAEPVRPEAPAPVDLIPEPEDLSEQEQLRQILRLEKNPKVISDKMRAILKTKDEESKARHAAAHALPAEYTRERLLKMRGAEMRNLQQRYGFAALDERLNSKETN